jgi:hypothetical protein
MSMQEPGLDRHEWTSRLQALEDDMRSEPASALPELADLVEELLNEGGYDIEDRVGDEGNERDVVEEYRAARAVSDRIESGEAVDPGDIGAAIQGLRAVADSLIGLRGS